jgi:hypothetical protein
MARGLATAGSALALLVWASLAGAAAWGGITPGETLRREVEARYGKPTRERTVAEEGRTTVEWTYAGEQAPRGITRMVVSFGLIKSGLFQPDVVRALTLHTRRGVFPMKMIAEGWGKPDAIGTDEQTGQPAFRYDAKGLLVILDKTGSWAEMMVFAPERQ